MENLTFVKPGGLCGGREVEAVPTCMVRGDPGLTPGLAPDRWVLQPGPPRRGL